MNSRWFRPWWLWLLVPLAWGLIRLRFDTEVLNLLPPEVPAVRGVQLYQQKFSSSGELIITVETADREATSQRAQAIAAELRGATNFIADVIWQPPWLEYPEQTAELIAHLWLNQPPSESAALAARLTGTNLPSVLAATRDELTTTLSPTEIARLSYDPFGLTRLPESVTGAGPGFGPGDEVFASPDGCFRILFVHARGQLSGYRECQEWITAVKSLVAKTGKDGENIGFTGRPAFVAEISGSMQQDITISVAGTAVIIGVLFWFAHRRWKPMLWLLTLLAFILASTLALGGLLFGTINVVSMGFAAILLGLAVDYAVVHYQEALAHPKLAVPQIRRAIAPSIFWAAVTTISAFLVLNLGGLPGLAQLGSLVGLGVALSAGIMIYAFLPPLFPGRMQASGLKGETSPQDPSRTLPSRINSQFPIGPVAAYAATGLLVTLCLGVLLRGRPRLDASSKALEPRNSRAYAALETVQRRLSQNGDPVWLIIAGRDELEVARRLDTVGLVLTQARSNGSLQSFTLPTALWPRPDRQAANRTNLQQLTLRRDAFHSAAGANGFAPEALGLTDRLLDYWQAASASSGALWPTNAVSSWIIGKLTAREPAAQYAVGFLFAPTNRSNFAALADLQHQLPTDGVWLASWGLLGGEVLEVVRQNLWKMVLPMLGLVGFTLWLALRRIREILLSLGVLVLSGICLLAVMQCVGWSWNLLNLMAWPLILGTGVDYSLFMLLALRRHDGDLPMAHASVGRALLLCGGTAIAGFGMLGLSSNAGMASLGQVCACGIAGNMLIAIYLLPRWWQQWAQHPANDPLAAPSSLYGPGLWQLGLEVARRLPPGLSQAIARAAAFAYWACARRRRNTVVQNLLPAAQGNLPTARQLSRRLFCEFALKLVDLWRYEAGADVAGLKTDWHGWENFATAHARGHGVLIVTPHLGNWELGAAFFVKHNVPLLVLTQAEPDPQLTRMRLASRARRGVETLVVGEDPFAFVAIIKRLQAGATVALLVDRPPPATAIDVPLLGGTIQASMAAAELARASGCAIVPGIIVRQANGYFAKIMPELTYDRATIGTREARASLTAGIMRRFEDSIREYADQWYHFVPIWRPTKP